MAATGFLSRLKFWKRSVVNQNVLNDQYLNCPEYRLANKLKRYEKYISEIENIIMWDNPVLSALCILFVNLLFWILMSLEWRFFGIVSTGLLAMTIHEAWAGHVWPEISVQVPATPTSNPEPSSPKAEAVSRHLTSFYSNVKQSAVWICNLRTEQPGLFCCGGVLGSGFLLLIARSVSGLMLVYSLIMAALLGPGLVAHCVPPSLKLTVTQHFSCVNRAFSNYVALNDASDDEYLPNTTSEDLALLTRASDLNHDTYDSLTNPGSSSDMVSGLAMMPSHEEDSLATISDLEHGLSLPLDHSEDSDSNPDEHQIQFQSGHFNGDSSSDEEPFSKDLMFTEGDDRDSAVARGFSTLIAQAVTRNLASSVGLLAGVLRPQPTTSEKRSRRETDSDLEDFEVINRDELGS